MISLISIINKKLRFYDLLQVLKVIHSFGYQNLTGIDDELYGVSESTGCNFPDRISYKWRFYFCFAFIFLINGFSWILIISCRHGLFYTNGKPFPVIWSINKKIIVCVRNIINSCVYLYLVVNV